MHLLTLIMTVRYLLWATAAKLLSCVQVAAETTKGNTSKAIELLRTYVDTFMTDRDAWAELADLYLEVDSPVPTPPL